jgi:hypothetical protein
MAEETPSGDAYSVVLADLRAKRNQIDNAIAAIEAISGQTGHDGSQNQSSNHGAGGQQGGQVRAGAFHGMSIVEAVKQLLAMRKKPLGTPEITLAIQEGGVVFSTETPANTVSSVLHREAAKAGGGSVISVGRAMWALPAWYPNPGRFQKKKAAVGESETEAPEVSEDSKDGVEGII